MKKHIKNIPFFILVILFFSCKEENSDKIIIATASNMQFAMEELAKEFTSQTKIKCELTVSSSGKLTAQIKEGAPFAVFVAANLKYPQEIFDSGLGVEKPKVYAYGKLVLWTFDETIEPSIEMLSDKKVKHIALANKMTAPYGFAASEVLEYYGLTVKIAPKLVFGESISQTNQFITSRAVEVGFTAKSVVVSPKMKGKGNWIELDEKAYTPIKQGVVVVRQEKMDNAQKFYQFLFSEKAKIILKKHGYFSLK